MTAFAVSPTPARMAEAFGELAADLNDWREAWRRISALIPRAMAANLQSQGGSLGEVWPELNQIYARRKSREGRGRAMLYFSGAFFSDVLNGRADIAPMGARFDVGDKVGAIQNFGVSGRLPPRRWFGLPPDSLEEFLGVLEAYVDQSIERWEERVRA